MKANTLAPCCDSVQRYFSSDATSFPKKTIYVNTELPFITCKIAQRVNCMQPFTYIPVITICLNTVNHSSHSSCCNLPSSPVRVLQSDARFRHPSFKQRVTMHHASICILRQGGASCPVTLQQGRRSCPESRTVAKGKWLGEGEKVLSKKMDNVVFAYTFRANRHRKILG